MDKVFIRKQTARKEHTCSWCDRTIRPGEMYENGIGFDGHEESSTWVTCQHCAYVLDHYDIMIDGEYTNDTLAEWAEYASEFVDEARMQAGYRNGWMTARGNLWPLPGGEAE